MRFWLFVALPTALLAVGLACDGKDMTVGSAPATTAPAAFFTPGRTWSGYIESYKLASGSDRIMIRVTSPTSGTVIFGAPGTAMPFLNPDVGYPVAGKASEAADRPIDFVEGFPFTILDASQDDVRVQFRIQVDELFKAWCTAQTPQCTDGDCQCGVGGLGSCPADPDAGDEALACETGFLCGRECACTATGCGVRDVLPGLRDVHFDLRIAGNEVNGNGINPRILPLSGWQIHLKPE